jgi:hypothetical protein
MKQSDKQTDKQTNDRAKQTTQDEHIRVVSDKDRWVGRSLCILYASLASFKRHRQRDILVCTLQLALISTQAEDLISSTLPAVSSFLPAVCSGKFMLGLGGVFWSPTSEFTAKPLARVDRIGSAILSKFCINKHDKMYKLRLKFERWWFVLREWDALYKTTAVSLALPAWDLVTWASHVTRAARDTPVGTWLPL